MVLPVCIALLLGARTNLARLVLGSVAFLIVVAVIVTFSRAGFLTLVFIGACYGWLLRNRPQRVLIPIVLVMGILALPLVPSSYFDRIDTIVNIEEDQTGSAQERLADMKAAVKRAFSSPIVGSGLGMSAVALNEIRGESWSKVHNVFLEIALDLGFVGMILFILLLYQCLRISDPGSANRTGTSDEDRTAYMVEALRVTLLAFALSAIFYPVSYNFYFYYFAGMAVAAGRIVRGGGVVSAAD
jgi:O-antigen ligase